jgi:mannose-6-phosphate isomerase-like protein (cupin superfamily)
LLIGSADYFPIEATETGRQISCVKSRILSRPASARNSISISEREERVVRPKIVPVPGIGVIVFESRHAPGFVGELKDDFSKFLLIIAGQAKWETTGKQITVATNSLVHIPAGQPHRQQEFRP